MHIRSAATREWNDALEAFRIPALRVAHLSGGWTNTTVRVTSTSGTIVLRRHEGLVRRRAAFERKFSNVDRIAALTTLVAAPLITSSGSYTFEASGGALYSASPYREGATAPRRSVAPAVLAAALASFHRASASIRSRIAPPVRSAETLGWLARRFEHFRSSSEVGHVLEWDAMRTLALQCARLLEGFRAAELPMLFVHGDLCAENVVIAGSKAVGVIDFDFLHYSERLYDVATLIDSLTGTQPHRDAEIINEVIETYDSTVPLRTAERRALDLFRVRRNLAMLWYIVARHGTLRGTPLRNARRMAALARTLGARAASA